MEKLIISTQENLKSEIIIQEDIRNDIQNFFEDKKYFLITNTKLAKLYPEFVYKFHDNRVIIIKDGEKYKNIKTFEYILNQLLKEKVNPIFELTCCFYLTQALTNFKKDSASKEAPPTKPPSMFSLLINSSILLGFTDPP